MSQLDKIEKRIRDIFESSPSILPWAGQDDRFVKRLCEALQRLFLRETPREFIRPNVQFCLNPETAARWQSQDSWEEQLANLLVSSAGEFGFRFRTKPQVLIVPDPSLAEEEIDISLQDLLFPQAGETGIISLPSNTIDEVPIKKSPMLILQGDRTIELDQPVINIGRKSSNLIVINDLRVSRVHAQFRKVKEDYMIFDVGSTGGTFINSNRIDSHTLRPGDVISLAGFTMIYTLDQSPIEETQKGITSEIKNIEENKED